MVCLRNICINTLPRGDSDDDDDDDDDDDNNYDDNNNNNNNNSNNNLYRRLELGMLMPFLTMVFLRRKERANEMPLPVPRMRCTRHILGVLRVH